MALRKKTLGLVIGIICVVIQARASESLTPLPPYDYSKHYNVSTPSQWEEGNQVLHSKSTNKYYADSPTAKAFVNTYMSDAKPLESDATVLNYASDAANMDGVSNGFFLEMGVGMGRTINFIAALNPDKIIHGFDSFEGLPEDWDKG